jgi:hypothetical protein
MPAAPQRLMGMVFQLNRFYSEEKQRPRILKSMAWPILPPVSSEIPGKASSPDTVGVY